MGSVLQLCSGGGDEPAPVDLGDAQRVVLLDEQRGVGQPPGDGGGGGADGRAGVVGGDLPAGDVLEGDRGAEAGQGHVGGGDVGEVAGGQGGEHVGAEGVGVVGEGAVDLAGRGGDDRRWVAGE